MPAPADPTPGFPCLLAPITLAGQTIRNRAIMGAMHTRLEHAADPLRRHVAFYEERARGEIGLIITGGFSPDEAGRMEPGAPILATAEQAGQHHRPVVDAVHAHGAKIILQILHAGRYARHDGSSARRRSARRSIRAPRGR